MEDTSKNSKKLNLNLFLYLAAVTVNFLGFAVGNAYGWSSPVLPMLKSNDSTINPLGVPTTQIEDSWISSLLSLGASIGPFIGGYFSDKIGRKNTLLFCALPMITSHVIIFFAHNVLYFYILRFLLGLGTGIVFTIVPIYIGEIAEISNRGLLGCAMGMLLSLGLLFCYSVGPYVSINTLSIFSLIPLVLFLVLFGIFIPESPYYLISINKDKEAEISLQKLRSSKMVFKEMEDIKANVKTSQQNTVSLKNAFRSKALRRGLTISCGIMVFQQFCGITVVLSYMQTIFDASGSSFPSDISTIIIALIQSSSVFASLQLVDRFGRKILLLSSISGTACSLGSLGFYFYLKESNSPRVNSLWWLPLASLLFYIICYNLGMGALPWAITGEIFSPSVKSMAASLTSFTCLFLAYLTTMFFPPIASVIGMAASFWIFTATCIFGIGFIYYFVPETKGKSFDEIFTLLDKKK